MSTAPEGRGCGLMLFCFLLSVFTLQGLGLGLKLLAYHWWAQDYYPEVKFNPGEHRKVGQLCCKQGLFSPHTFQPNYSIGKRLSPSPRSYTFGPYDLLYIQFLYVKGIRSLCQQSLQQTSTVLELIASSLPGRSFSQTPG